MSFLGALFGGGQKPAVTPTPPPPRIGDAAGQAAALQERSRVKKKYGVEDTMLGSPASGTTGGPTPTPRTRTMLG